MNKLVFGIALCMIVPAMRAQQADSSSIPPQPAPQSAQEAIPQPATQNQNLQDNLPPSLRPGHPLDPADVDILTGKHDREIAASQRAAVPFSVGVYGTYGDLYAMQGRFGRVSDIPMLPLTRIGNPFFFSTLQPRGFGGGGFRGGR